MQRTTAIVEVLGGKAEAVRKLRSADDLNEWIRRGLPFAVLEAVVSRFHLNRDELSATLDLPARTLARRKLEQRLRPNESDRLYRFVRIATRASEVLGEEEKALQWLRAPNRALGGQPPLSRLDTDLGARQVEDILGRIEHGVFS